MISVRLLALIAAAIALSARTSPAAQPTWRMLETPRFTVVSQLGDKATREWAEEFSQFIEELRLAFRAERPHVPPLTVVLFARDRDFSRYQPLRSDGRGPASIAGFFNHQGNWSVIGLADRYAEKSTRELIFHEAVHWFMSTDPVNYPLWLSEGLAEVFSTFRQEKGKVHWGAAISAHVALLREERMLPFERFLFLTHHEHQSRRTGMFYAQSWVFVHYLMFGAHNGSRDALTRYLDMLDAGTHPDEAFVQAFGRDYAAMERTLATYIRTGRYETRIRPESSAAKLSAVVAPAPEPAVEVALTRLALAAERLDNARLHAARAVALAPDQPAGHEMLAQVLYRTGDAAHALASCQRAEQLGSQDAATLFLLAYLSADSSLKPGGDSVKAREIARLYRRAIAVCPTMEEAYQNLAGLASALESVENEDIDALKRGARLFPRRGDIWLGLAHFANTRGDRAGAGALLAKARECGLPLDVERIATRMEEVWLYDDTSARIDELMRADRFSEALTVCEGAMARVTDIYSRGTLAQTRHDIAIRARMHEAEKALRAGELGTARQLYEAVLADPSFPMSLRQAVDDVLRRLPAPLPASLNAATP